MRANGNIYHTINPNNFRDVEILHQEKASMDMTHNGIKSFTSTSSNKNINDSLLIGRSKKIQVVID